MDAQSIINCLEALRDKMTPEQIEKLEALKAEQKRHITIKEVGNESISTQ